MDTLQWASVKEEGLNHESREEGEERRRKCVDGARGRARTAILPRVHLGGEPQMFYFFRVFRAFRGLNDFYYSCPFVSISGSITLPP